MTGARSHTRSGDRSPDSEDYEKGNGGDRSARARSQALRVDREERVVIDQPDVHAVGSMFSVSWGWVQVPITSRGREVLRAGKAGLRPARGKRSGAAAHSSRGGVEVRVGGRHRYMRAGIACGAATCVREVRGCR